MARLTKKYNLSAAQAEAKLKHPLIEIELDPIEGSDETNSVFVEPPQLWPDEVGELAAEGKMTEVSKILLGDQYDRFKAGGGSNAILNVIIAEHSGADTGK
jgi:hypothetical protein